MDHSFSYHMGEFIGLLLGLLLLIPIITYVLNAIILVAFLALTAVATVLNGLAWTLEIFSTNSNSCRTSFNGYIPKERLAQRVRDDNIPIL